MKGKHQAELIPALYSQKDNYELTGWSFLLTAYQHSGASERPIYLFSYCNSLYPAFGSLMISMPAVLIAKERRRMNEGKQLNLSFCSPDRGRLTSKLYIAIL